MVEKYFRLPFIVNAMLQGILYIYVRLLKGEEGTLKIHRQGSKIG